MRNPARMRISKRKKRSKAPRPLLLIYAPSCMQLGVLCAGFEEMKYFPYMSGLNY